MDIASQIEQKINVEETVRELRVNGCSFFEGLFDEATLSRLSSEFDRVFSEPPPGATSGTRPPGCLATIDTLKWEPASLPTISAIFMADRFRSIHEALLPQGSTFNDAISLTHDTQVMPITDIHFDSQRALKFLIYLLDTDMSNGAFAYAKKSHHENVEYRNSFLQQRGKLLDIQNVISGPELASINLATMEGRAGSLVIFDTDGWHTAGVLRDASKERRIIRSRCIFAGQPPLRVKRFSLEWWRRKHNIFPPRPPFELPGRRRTAGTSRKI